MSTTLVLSAAGILLREGLEAMLVITALATYLSRIGATDKLRALWVGGTIGIAASAVTAWVFSAFYGGQHNDLLEGVTMLAAATLMLYVSGWLYLKQNPALWQKYLKGQVDKAVQSGSMLTVGAIAFLSIYREGAETALFLNALAQGASGWNFAIISGLLFGTAALVGLFVVLRTTALRLPLRPLFMATSAFLFAMALMFIADGLVEFQELGWLSYHELPPLLSLGGLLGGYSLEQIAISAMVGLNAAAFTLMASSRQPA